jgi:hypothetical protein
MSLGIDAQTHAATSKTTPVDADEVPITDSASSFSLKKLTWGNLKATLKAYFDGIYANLSSPALTGTPTAPTAVSGTNTTQIATTAFAKSEITATVSGANVSLSANGYQKLPSGLIIQWGNLAVGSSTTVNFNIAFPNNCFICVTIADSNDPWGFSLISSWSNTSFSFARARSNGTKWIAIGN